MYDPTRPPLPPDMMQTMGAPASVPLPDLQRGQLYQPTAAVPHQGSPFGADLRAAFAGMDPRAILGQVQAWLATRPEGRDAIHQWLGSSPIPGLGAGQAPAAPQASAPLPAPVTPSPVSVLPQANQVAGQRPVPGNAAPYSPQPFPAPAKRPTGGFFGTGRGR